MARLIRKTMIMLDSENYLIYLNHSLLIERGNGYVREKAYLKRLVEECWNVFHCNPDELQDAECIEIIKDTFGLKDLEII